MENIKKYTINPLAVVKKYGLGDLIRFKETQIRE